MAVGNLHRTLIKNYIVFVTTLIAISILALLFLGFTLNSQMDGEVSPRITASDVYVPDYEKMDISDIRLLGGWVEILDEGGRVVFVKGEKKTSEEFYEKTQLYRLLSFDRNLGNPGGSNNGKDNSNSTDGYLCTAKVFPAQNGMQYTCLAFLPGDSAELQLNLVKSGLPVAKKFITILLISLFFFLLAFAANVFLFGKWSAKKISRPLDGITGALRELRGGKYGTRMDFKAENEFLQIRDAFNEMAEKLERSQTEKAKLEAARSRMFVDISHDLKTPITVINAYSKALAEGMVKEEEQKHRYYETIYNKSSRVSGMIDNVFELAKLENGASSLNRETTDMTELLRGIAAEYYEQAEEKGLVFDLKIMDEKMSCSTDKKELSRAISNLISNAIQYNTAGTTIRIGMHKADNGVSIDISDDGAGIPEQLKETLFDPFVRGDPSRGSDGGTGLGLAIARRIVEKHGGILVLQSEEKYNTVFRIILP